jgi:hypothetical protein
MRLFVALTCLYATSTCAELLSPPDSRAEDNSASGAHVPIIYSDDGTTDTTGDALSASSVKFVGDMTIGTYVLYKYLNSDKSILGHKASSLGYLATAGFGMYLWHNAVDFFDKGIASTHLYKVSNWISKTFWPTPSQLNTADTKPAAAVATSESSQETTAESSSTATTSERAL